MKTVCIHASERLSRLRPPIRASRACGFALLAALFTTGGIAPASGQGLMPTEASPRTERGIVLEPVQARIKKDTALRAGPGNSHPIIASVRAGSAASILSSKDGWHELDVTGRGEVMIGWAPHKAVVVAVESAAPGVPMTGRVTGRVNVRSGPGTGNPVIGKGKPGQEVSLLSTRGDWYEVIGTFKDDFGTGWIRHDFVAADVQTRHWAVAAKQQVYVFDDTARNAAATSSDLVNWPLSAGERRVIYSGYSERFLPVKAEMRRGRFDLAVVRFKALNKPAAGSEQDQNPGRQTDGNQDMPGKSPTDSPALMATDAFLEAVELGTLALDSGAPSDAIQRFGGAETALVERKTRSKTKGTLKKIFDFLGEAVTGDEEIAEYQGQGYERILMLNYKTIAYLLRGERLAYNVTRRAIDWQNTEKRRFEAKLREVKAKLGELDRESDKSGGRYDQGFVDRIVGEQYAALDARASSVPSAYVNPFGYYVAGMVHEFESASDITLRDNARIAYEKALKLNPNAAVLKQAVAELSRLANPRKGRLLHVVVAEGFAPEKKTSLYGLRFRDQVLPVKLPIYVPVPSRVRRIEVRDMKDKTLQVLSPLADIEAIALRHQKDSQPFQNLRVGLAVARSAGEKWLFSKLGPLGQVLGNWRDATSTPDMRAWMSLPARIQVARLHLPKGTERIQLVSIGQGGRELARTTVPLGKGRHRFVYARSLEDQLVAHVSETLWMDKP